MTPERPFTSSLHDARSAYDGLITDIPRWRTELREDGMIRSTLDAGIMIKLFTDSERVVAGSAMALNPHLAGERRTLGGWIHMLAANDSARGATARVLAPLPVKQLQSLLSMRNDFIHGRIESSTRPTRELLDLVEVILRSSFIRTVMSGAA